MKNIKLYTKTGDKGTTGLADGSRINKNNLRIKSYGNIDELNSIIAICKEYLTDLSIDHNKLIDKWLFAIQNDLFNIGSDLATPIHSRWKNMTLICENDVAVLEKIIDFCQESIPPLKEFILPGGSLLNAHLHLARTVCRRAERDIVTLAREEEINEFIIIYVNRLSDLFFVLSRWVQHKFNRTEIKWGQKDGVRDLTI